MSSVALAVKPFRMSGFASGFRDREARGRLGGESASASVLAVGLALPWPLGWPLAFSTPLGWPLGWPLGCWPFFAAFTRPLSESSASRIMRLETMIPPFSRLKTRRVSSSASKARTCLASARHMRATCLASLSFRVVGGMIRWPGGSDMDMIQSMRIQRPCAASEQTDKAGSVSQSFHQNLPQGRPLTDQANG
jgi:hypothetical protein